MAKACAKCSKDITDDKRSSYCKYHRYLEEDKDIDDDNEKVAERSPSRL